MILRSAQQSALTVGEWLEQGRRVAAGTLVAVDGSSPLDVGASVYIDSEGAIEGSVTGGCVESAVAQEALAMLDDTELAPKLVTYGISDELAGTAGLMCGGIVHIFIAPISDSEPVAAALAAVAEQRPAALATLLDGEHAGARMYIDESGSIGSLGGALLDSNVAQEARGMTVQGRSTVREFGCDGASLGSGLRVHVAAFGAPPQMVIFGAIDFASALAPLAAGLGYRVTIADPRRAFLDSPRFSTAAKTVVVWPVEALAQITLGPRDAALVFTHDPKLDVPALRAALDSGAGYIGALGSRNTTAQRNERLREAGIAEAEIGRIHAPCGLDIGAATVEETAVAILAEIVADRAGRSGRPLREASGSIRRSADALSPAP